jgi:hypothetical protein
MVDFFGCDVDGSLLDSVQYFMRAFEVAAITSRNIQRASCEVTKVFALMGFQSLDVSGFYANIKFISSGTNSNSQERILPFVGIM